MLFTPVTPKTAERKPSVPRRARLYNWIIGAVENTIAWPQKMETLSKEHLPRIIQTACSAEFPAQPKRHRSDPSLIWFEAQDAPCSCHFLSHHSSGIKAERPAFIEGNSRKAPPTILIRLVQCNALPRWLRQP